MALTISTSLPHGITVTNTPGVLTEDTADMTITLILAVPRRLVEGERLMRSGEWPGWSLSFMLGRSIWGKRLGIVGMGRIGTALARRARIRARDPLPQSKSGRGQDRIRSRGYLLG